MSSLLLQPSVSSALLDLLIMVYSGSCNPAGLDQNPGSTLLRVLSWHNAPHFDISVLLYMASLPSHQKHPSIWI